METTVYFATNRNADPAAPHGFGNHYNPDGPYCVRYGWAQVKVPSDPYGGAYTITQAELAPEANAGPDADPSRPRIRGSDLVFDGLRNAMKRNGSDLLILIHGFGCTFEDALKNAAQLRTLYATKQRPLEVAVFSWPTDGRTFAPTLSSGLRAAYFSDRMDAEASREAIARALRRLVEYFQNLAPEDACGRRMHLVAHSMGNYVLRHAVQSFARDYKPGGMPRLFENIFHMAADEDDDAFELPHKYQRVPELASSVHVYFAANDMALHISDGTKGNPDRLGSTGPRTLTDLPRKVILVDCAAVSDTGGTDAQHQYYRKRPEVVADVRAVLAGQVPDAISQRVYSAAERAFRLVPAARRRK
jgi:esterase/lipase superfamily enzyme